MSADRAGGSEVAEQRTDPVPRRRAVTVVTVDDQPYFRAAARDVIALTGGFEPVGEASSGAEALDVVAELEPALVLLDVRMPGMDGIETARRIKARRPATVVVLVSIESLGDVGDAAAASGAAALISKRGFGPAVLRRLWSAHGARDAGALG